MISVPDMARPLAVATLLFGLCKLHAEPPASLAGQVSRDGKVVSQARIEVTMVSPKSTDSAFGHRLSVTDGAGRFLVLGLRPAKSYAVRITFPDGFSAWGYVDDVRNGEVRYITSTRQAWCGTTYWQESELPLRETFPVFRWPARQHRNRVAFCE